MICEDVSSRSSRGLSTMKKRPVLAVWAPPVLPVNEPKPATSGSCRSTSPNSRMMRIICSGAVSCAASAKPEITPVSWIGKKPLGIVNSHDHGQRHGGEEDSERDRLVAQHDVERAPVERQHRVEAGLDDPVDAAVVVRFAMHEARAQHRRERERDQRGDRDRGRHGQGEFAEQTADDSAHEQQRDEHRDQRQADRQHGEADLARSLDRRLERRAAMLDVAIDVLNHHDGVVDHEADGDRQRHQRQIVETEVEQVHRRARAEQRERHGDARDRRGPEVAQEQQNHQHDEADGEREREFHVRHRGTNGRGAVQDGFDLDGGRNPGGQLRKLRLDLVDRFDDVGAGLLEHRQDDSGLVVLIGRDRAIDLPAAPPGRHRVTRIGAPLR